MKSDIFQRVFFPLVIVIVSCDSLALELVPSPEGQQAYQRFIGRATKLAAAEAEAAQNSGSPSNLRGRVLPPEKSALPHTDQVIFGGIDQVQEQIPLGFNKIPKTTYRPQPSTTAPLHKEYEIPNLQLPAQSADAILAAANDPEASDRNSRKFEVPSGKLPSETSNPPAEIHYHDEYDIPNLQLPNGPITAHKPQVAVDSEEEFVIPKEKIQLERTVAKAQAGKQYDKVYEIANLELPPLGPDQKEQKKPSNVYLTPNTPLPTHRIEGTRYTPEKEPPKAIPYSEYKPPSTSSLVASQGSSENPSVSSSSYGSQSRPSSSVPFPRVVSRVIFPTTSSPTSLPPTYNTNSYTTPASSYKTSTPQPEKPSGPPANPEERVLDYGSPALPVTEIRHVITYVLPPSYGNPLGLQPDHQQLKSDIESSIKDLFQPFGPTYFKRIYTTQLIK